MTRGSIAGDSAARKIVILGSTGSVGTQAIDIVRRNRDRFDVVGLAAAGNNMALLASQAIDLGVAAIAVADETRAAELERATAAAARRAQRGARHARLPEVIAGPHAAAELASHPCHAVLNGISGSVGLLPTLAALEAGRVLVLANKESLVVGGLLVKTKAAPGQIVPVDTEHSGLAQCLHGHRDDVRQLIITASGGPFFRRSPEELWDVTPTQALAHPTWDMGKTITINSATLVNKGLEIIEANLLFDVPIEQIRVLVHPQSVVHAMVEYRDGSTVAQVSPPDMRLALSIGLQWPDRVPDAISPCDWTKASAWEFYPLDENHAPGVRLAREVGTVGGTLPAVFNAANEECVAAFLRGALRFPGILNIVEQVITWYAASRQPRPGDATRQLPAVEEILLAEGLAREQAQRLIAGAAPATPIGQLNGRAGFAAARRPTTCAFAEEPSRAV